MTKQSAFENGDTYFPAIRRIARMDTIRMNTIPNGHHPEYTQSRMDTIPNEHHPECALTSI